MTKQSIVRGVVVVLVCGGIVLWVANGEGPPAPQLDSAGLTQVSLDSLAEAASDGFQAYWEDEGETLVVEAPAWGTYDYTIAYELAFGPLAQTWEAEMSIPAGTIRELPVAPGALARVSTMQDAHPSRLTALVSGYSEDGNLKVRELTTPIDVWVETDGSIVGGVPAPTEVIMAAFPGEDEPEGIETGPGPGRIADITYVRQGASPDDPGDVVQERDDPSFLEEVQ